MGTLSENLSYIDAIKSDIRSAIENKGVDMTGYSFPDYPAAISQISGDGYDQASICMRDYGTTLNNSASFVHQYAFTVCSLRTVSLSSCEYVDTFAFSNCWNLSSVSLPVASRIGSYAFYGCTNLNNLYLPQVREIGSSAFNECMNLSSYLWLPSCSYIGYGAFRHCYNLTTVDLPVCSFITTGAFSGDGSLRSVYLGSTSVCSYDGMYPFPSSLGLSLTVYVPSSLVSDYQADSAWGQYNIESMPS